MILAGALALALSTTTFAQTTEDDTPTRVVELGAQTNNLSDYRAVIRFGNERSVWRISAFNFAINTGETVQNTNYEMNVESYAFGLSLGKEWRTEMMENLYFRYGADLAGFYSTETRSYTYVDDPTQDSNNLYGRISASANAVFGALYVVNDQWVFGAEFTPGLSWTQNSYGWERPNDPTAGYSNSSSSLSGNLNQSIGISAAFRF